MFRFYSGIFLFSQQDSLGGHGDSAEMPAAITECFTNQNELYLAEPFVKIGTQMLSSDRRCVAVNVVLFIDLPPRIKDGAGRRLFQQADEALDRLLRHKVPKVFKFQSAISKSSIRSQIVLWDTCELVVTSSDARVARG